MDEQRELDHEAPGLATRDFLQSLVAQLEPRLPFAARVGNGASDQASPESVAAWQRELRGALWEVLGVAPEAPGPVGVRVTESAACEGYVRHRVLVDGALGGTVPAYVLVPESIGTPSENTPSDRVGSARARRRPGAPGVLCLHGHGANNAGKALVAGAPTDGAEAAYIEAHGYDFAVRLARRGYVALVPDALGFGERAPDRSARYHGAMGLVAEYLGTSLVGLRLLDDQRALTALAEWPGVDPNRLGATGLSEGGKRALFLAALDERVRAAAVSGYFTTLRLEALTWERFGGWDLCNHLFGLLRLCDLPDVAALAAPRALLIQHGREDRLYGVAEVEDGFETVRRAYAAAGSPDNCVLDLFDGGHVYRSQPVEEWFDRFLSG